MGHSVRIVSSRRAICAVAVLLLLASAAASDAQGDDPAIRQSEFIDPAPPYPQSHASTIAQLGDGTLAAAWFGGTEEGAADVAIRFARRGPQGWSKPVAVADGRMPGGRRYPTWNPVLFQPPGGPLHLFYKVGADPRHWRGMTITSADGGAHWSAPRALPESILGPSKNKPVIAPDGSWLSPSSREVGTVARNRWFLRIERSVDRGRRWHAGPPIASPLGLEAIQPSILRLPGGRIELLARTRQGVIAMSVSQDSGRSWTPLAAAGLPNPNSGIDAVTLADGRQLLVYNHAVPSPETPGYGPRWPLNVALSDDGIHWRPVLMLERAPLPEGYAYPAVIQARDGLVHVTYTYDRRLIRHVVLDPKQLR